MMEKKKYVSPQLETEKTESDLIRTSDWISGGLEDLNVY